jgi:DNA-binding NarL/FixJ family response regulator
MAGEEPRSARVVVVDDEALVRSGLRLILESAPDIRVVATSDGVHAIDEIRRHHPDVVLLDVRMPRVDGLTVLRQVTRWAHPPAVAMLTTFDTSEHIGQALAAGAAGFLLKDTDPAQLIHAVRVLASGGKILSPGATETVIAGYLSTGADREARALLDAMTPRERDVLALLGEGLSNAAIARRLNVSAATVKDHVSTVLAKLAVGNRVQAAVIARDAGLVDRPSSRAR